MLQMLLLRGAIPAITALAIAIVYRYLLPGDVARRSALSIGLAGGYFLGYVLLPEWAPLAPQKTWHWIAYVSILAGLFGSLSFAGGVRFFERWLVQFFLGLLTAYLLMPSWADIQPVRHIYIPALGLALFLLCTLLEPLAARVHPVLFAAVLAIVATCAVVLGAAEISLKLGEVLMPAASAAFGCAVAAVFGRTLDVRAMVLGYVLVVGGLIFTMHLEPQTPLRGMLLLPAAPLAMWIGLVGPLARLRSWPRMAVQSVAVAIVVAIAALLVVLKI